MLFLRLLGVGPEALLPALRVVPGDLASLRNDIDWKKKNKQKKNYIYFRKESLSSSVPVAAFVPGWSDQIAALLHSLKEISG